MKKTIEIVTPAAWRAGGGDRGPHIEVGLMMEEWDFINSLDVPDPVEYCLKHATADYIRARKTDPPHFDQTRTDVKLKYPVIPELWEWLLVRGGTVVDHLTAAILDYIRKKGFEGDRPC